MTIATWFSCEKHKRFGKQFATSVQVRLDHYVQRTAILNQFNSSRDFVECIGKYVCGATLNTPINHLTWLTNKLNISW